ncbi:MAG: FAD-dependent oxidoreductase [Leisingera sp.]
MSEFESQWQRTYAEGAASRLPVFADVDVVVVGGGAAGVAAAETLGRKGRSVLLIERYGFCGGGAVAGLSGTICGMFLSTENDKATPEQVTFGWAEKFRAALASRNGVSGPQRYGKTFTVTHDPLVWREVADGFLRNAGVQILYHSQVVGVLMEGDAFEGVIVNSKSGLAQVRAKRIIDASGDGDVIHRAGFKTTKGNNGAIQNPTMIFRMGGIDVDRFCEYWGEDTISPQKVIDQLIAADPEGGRLPRKKIWIFPTTRPGELMVNATRILGFDGRDLDVTNPVDHSEGELVARLQVREYADFLRRHIPGCEKGYVNDTGVEIGIRQTRTVTGIETLTNEVVLGRAKSPNAIARSPWPIELHAGTKPKVEWLFDDTYEIPYGTLVPFQGENIIVAGRCLSAEHEALASARVTAQCFGYGHAAALAADLSIKENIAIREIQGADIRTLLNQEGARL